MGQLGQMKAGKELPNMAQEAQQREQILAHYPTHVQNALRQKPTTEWKVFLQAVEESSATQMSASYPTRNTQRLSGQLQNAELSTKVGTQMHQSLSAGGIGGQDEEQHGPADEEQITPETLSAENATKTAIKIRAVNDLVNGKSILIPFAELAIRLPGWSSEVADVTQVASIESEAEGNVVAINGGEAANDDGIEADFPLPGAISSTRVTFDIGDVLVDAIQTDTSSAEIPNEWGFLSRSRRYYTTADSNDEEDTDDDNIIIPEDYDDIDSLADLEPLEPVDDFDIDVAAATDPVSPLSPQSWEFSDGEEVGAEDEIAIPASGVPEIVISPPDEDVFPALEESAIADMELEGCF